MKKQLLSGLAIGGLMIAASLRLKYLNAHGVIPDTAEEISRRTFNVILGLLAVFITNLAPKNSPPLSEMSCNPTCEQNVRRFIAMAIVAGGLLYSLVWFIAPFDLARPLSIAAIGGSLAIAIGRFLVAIARR